jgi:class 3 adenylate cyclase
MANAKPLWENARVQPPTVHYVTTSDGVRIAYSVSGSGPPAIVLTDPSVSHVELEWSQPVMREVYGRLAEDLTLIRIDIRGTGLSDRVTSVTEQTVYGEIRAVVEQLGLRRYVLGGVQIMTPAAITYAARYPAEVTHLVLVDGCLSVMQLFTSPQLAAVIAAGQADWVTGTEAIGAFTFGAGRQESVGLGSYVRSCIGPEFFPLAMQATRVHDATKAASDVRAPTLVIKHAGNNIDMGVARSVVTAIPGAVLMTLPGLWAEEPRGLGGRIVDWITSTPEADPTARPASARAPSSLRVILFTDIEGHTAMMQRLGDDAGRAVLREHERLTRETLRAHGGDEVKTMGDGFMASFPSATEAAHCAADLQRAISSMPQGISVRVGLNAGEPIAEDGDLFGASVILASRIAARASGGEILVSDVVRGLLIGKGFLFADRGEAVLRGFEDAIRLYELRWREPAR